MMRLASTIVCSLLCAGSIFLASCGSSDKSSNGGVPAGGSAGQASGGTDASGGSDSGGSSGSGGSGGSAGQAAFNGATGQAIVAGGVVARSENFTAILTLGEAPGGNGSAKSENQRLNSGLVGTTQ